MSTSADSVDRRAGGLQVSTSLASLVVGRLALIDTSSTALVIPSLGWFADQIGTGRH